MASYQLALIVKNPRVENFEFLVTRQRRPSEKKFEDLPYVDKELWDLPSARLSRFDGTDMIMSPISEDSDGSVNVAKIVSSAIQKLGLKGFDVMYAISQIQEQVAPPGVTLTPWRYWKLVEESEYGPGPPMHTVIFMTDSYIDKSEVPGGGQWLDSQTTMDMLVQWGAHSTRIGPLAALAASTHVPDGLVANFQSISGQEYPPGVVVLPMRCRSLKPFLKTNLVIFSPSNLSGQCKESLSSHAATGDVLICDPGCIGAAKAELAQIVKALPRKLLVFLTHHHSDHTDGLPVVRKNNPEAVLVAHGATFQRMGKATKGFKCITVDGGSKLMVAGHLLEVISAPGHTDGHLAIYDAATGTLVVMEKVERWIREHLEDPKRSILARLVPSVGRFYTPLPLVRALQEYDEFASLSRRRYVPPNFAEIRHVLNIAQVHAIAGQLSLITFDADGTLYADGHHIQRDNKMIDHIIKLMQEGCHVAIVTAAGYPGDAGRYEGRLAGLLAAFKDLELPPRITQLFHVMGGECNYLLRVTNDYRLDFVPDNLWKTRDMQEWSESDVQKLLDEAEASLISAAARLRLPVELIRKPRAVGAIPKEPTIYEVLEEMALTVQMQLIDSKLPYCAFNGGNDVFVDVGNKSVGLEALMKFLRKTPKETLHVGDRFTLSGNDSATRSKCSILWVANPEETGFFTRVLLREVQLSRLIPYIE